MKETADNYEENIGTNNESNIGAQCGRIFIDARDKLCKDMSNKLVNEVLMPCANDIGSSIIDAIRNTYISVITSRRPIDDWAQISIQVIDRMNDNIARQNNWQYIGGKLNFAISKQSSRKVVIFFELYYQDKNKGWNKVTAKSEEFDSNFTFEDLDEMRSKGIISFEVT